MINQETNAILHGYDEPLGASLRHDALESLEARLWERARRNLRLLYNGGRPAPADVAEVAEVADLHAVVGPLAAANPKA